MDGNATYPLALTSTLISANDISPTWVTARPVFGSRKMRGWQSAKSTVKAYLSGRNLAFQSCLVEDERHRRRNGRHNIRHRPDGRAARGPDEQFNLLEDPAEIIVKRLGNL